MMRPLFIFIISLLGIISLPTAVSAPIYGDSGQSRSLPAPKAGEVEGFLNSERGPSADIQVLTLESGTRHTIEALQSGNYSAAKRWAAATKEFLADKKLPVPRWLVQMENTAAEGLIRELLVEADIAIHQALLPRASAILEIAAEISAKHDDILIDEISKMFQKTREGRGNLLLKFWNDKPPAWGYFNFKV